MSCYHYLNLYCPMCGKLIDKQNYVLKGKQKVCMECDSEEKQFFKRIRKYTDAYSNDKLDQYHDEREKKLEYKRNKKYVDKNKTLEV